MFEFFQTSGLSDLGISVQKKKYIFLRTIKDIDFFFL